MQESGEIDSHLWVTDGNDELVDEDDDSASNSDDSPIPLTVAPTSDYTIWPASSESDGTGTLTLSVESVAN